MATLVLKIGERELQRLPITKTRTWIGRDHTCDLTLDNEAVSRRHCWIEPEGDRFAVHDNRSGNGTYINGAARESALLANGAEIHLGKFTVVFLELGGLPIENLTWSEAVGEDDPIVAPTTHLAPEYMEKVREKLSDLQERPPTRPRDITRRRAAVEPGGTSPLILVVVGIVIGAAAAVALYFLRGE